MNRRVNIREDIKRYQDTLSYASSKVDYSVGENIYMLPSDMNLKIRLGTVRYNNKILISDGKFSLGENDKVNETPKISHQPTITQAQKPNITHVQKQTITQAQNPTHEGEKIALILFLTGGFTIWFLFRRKSDLFQKVLHKVQTQLDQSSQEKIPSDKWLCNIDS